MDRHFFERRCHFSIRKYAIGVASVMIGASIFGANVVQAAETNGTPKKEGTVTQAQPLDKLPDDLAPLLKNAELEATADTSHGENHGGEETTKPTAPATEKPATSPVAPKPTETSKPADNQTSENKPATTIPVEK